MYTYIVTVKKGQDSLIGGSIHDYIGNKPILFILYISRVNNPACYQPYYLPYFYLVRILDK